MTQNDMTYNISLVIFRPSIKDASLYDRQLPERVDPVERGFFQKAYCTEGEYAPFLIETLHHKTIQPEISNLHVFEIHALCSFDVISLIKNLNEFILNCWDEFLTDAPTETLNHFNNKKQGCTIHWQTWQAGKNFTKAEVTLAAILLDDVMLLDLGEFFREGDDHIRKLIKDLDLVDSDNFQSSYKSRIVQCIISHDIRVDIDKYGRSTRPPYRNDVRCFDKLDIIETPRALERYFEFLFMLGSTYSRIGGQRETYDAFARIFNCDYTDYEDPKSPNVLLARKIFMVQTLLDYNTFIEDAYWINGKSYRLYLLTLYYYQVSSVIALLSNRIFAKAIVTDPHNSLNVDAILSIVTDHAKVHFKLHEIREIYITIPEIYKFVKETFDYEAEFIDKYNDTIQAISNDSRISGIWYKMRRNELKELEIAVNRIIYEDFMDEGQIEINLGDENDIIN